MRYTNHMNQKPIVYLLCGLPASGKTEYAKKLELQGVVRFTLDEELFKRFGREYTDHAEKQEYTKSEISKLVAEKVKAGNSVAVDFGFWKKADRDAYKKFVEDIGGEWKLLYFKADKKVLLERLLHRNVTNPGSNHIISAELLEKFMQEFEAPSDEGEEVIL